MTIWSAPARQRRRAAQLVVALVLLVWFGAALCLTGHSSPRPAVSATESASGASAAAAVDATAAAKDVGAATVEAEKPAAGMPLSRVAGDAPAAGADRVWDLCGIGRVPWPASPAASVAEAPEMPDHLWATPLAAARQQLIAALRQGSPRAQAVAAWMNGEPAERLQRLSQASGDPVIALWALNRCPSGDRGCRQARTEAWYRLAPTNATAALAALDEGVLDRSRALSALRRATSADAHFGAAAAEAAAVPLPGVWPYLRQTLLVEVWGAEIAMGASGILALSGLCPKGMDAAESEQRALCSQLATLLVERSDNLLFVAMGAGIGQRSGWSAEQVARVRDELKALRLAQQLAVPLDQPPMGCAAVQATQRWAEQVGRLGELGAARALRAQDPVKAASDAPTPTQTVR